MFKIFNSSNCPLFYKTFLSELRRFHNHTTRGFNDLKLPFFKNAICQRLLFYQGPKLWNMLPDNLKLSKSSQIFKRNFKEFLIDKY